MSDFFKTSELFSKLSETDKSTLASVCTEKKIKKDEILFREKNIGESVFFLSDGIMKIAKTISPSETITLAMVKSGEVFGELAIIDSVPRYADACALSDAVVYELKNKDLIGLRSKNPALAFAVTDIINSSMAKRLRKITNKMYGIY